MPSRRRIIQYALTLTFLAAGRLVAQDDPPVEKPREIHLDTRILRYQFRKGAAPAIETVATQSFKTLENMPAAMSVDGIYSLEITPKLATGGGMLINGKLSMPAAKGEPPKTVSNARKASAGVKTRVTGMTDADDKAIQETVRKGDLPADGSCTVYYLEVCARIAPA